MSIVATEFPQQNLGIDDFLFTCIVVPTPQHGNEIPTSLCRNFIPTSLSGNEIPTKWRGNEIPTNRPSELYTIYNPAPRRRKFKHALLASKAAVSLCIIHNKICRCLL